MAKVYSVQRPDDEDNGIFCGTYSECLAYIGENYTPEEIDEMNANAKYHGWQIAKIDDETDYCYDVIEISSDDIAEDKE